MNKLFSVLLLYVLLSSPSFAGEGEWTGQGEFGFALARGNSDNQTLTARLGLDKETERWKHNLFTLLQQAEADGLESARRYELGGSSGYRFGERSYAFGSLRHERDSYAPTEYQWTAALGYGFEAIKNDDTKLIFEIGPGYRKSKLQGEQIFDNGAVLRGFINFSHKLTETTTLFNELLIESGEDNTFARNTFGLQVQISEAFALKAGFEARHNTDVLPEIKKTDTLTTLNLVYGF